MTLSRWRSPLFSRQAGRIILEIPFDDSLDGGASNYLECFFQMPDGVNAIRSAKVWVQQKPFRTYNSAASSASGGTTVTSSTTSHVHPQVASSKTTGTSSDTAHTHSNSGNTGNQGATHTHVESGGGTTNAETQNHDHAYTTATGSSSAAHTHTEEGLGAFTDPETIVGGHTHTTNTAHTHTIDLTPGIFESGPTGTFSLQVADDGTNYGASIVTGQTSLTAQPLTGLTRVKGNKRIKLIATGLQRLQVLIVLDLEVAIMS